MGQTGQAGSLGRHGLYVLDGAQSVPPKTLHVGSRSRNAENLEDCEGDGRPSHRGVVA